MYLYQRSIICSIIPLFTVAISFGQLVSPQWWVMVMMVSLPVVSFWPVAWLVSASPSGQLRMPINDHIGLWFIYHWVRCTTKKIHLIFFLSFRASLQVFLSLSLLLVFSTIIDVISDKIGQYLDIRVEITGLCNLCRLGQRNHALQIWTRHVGKSLSNLYCKSSSSPSKGGAC